MTSPAVKLTGLVKTFDLGFLGTLPVVGSAFSKMQIKGIAQRVEAVRGVSLDVQPGEIFGFLGPNGAGKTTTIKMMMGLIRPTEGTAELLGYPTGDRRARARLGFLPEHPYFYDYLKPAEFLDFYGRLFSMSAQDRRRRSAELIDLVGLSHAVHRPLRKFSKGMVQRIGIAQALINDPDLIVLDEPMSGLDPRGRKDVRDIIFSLKEQGKTVFFSSHILQDVEEVCDRVGIMVQGKLTNVGVLSELLVDEAHQVDIKLTADPALVATLTTEFGTPRQLPTHWIFSVNGEGLANRLVHTAQAGGAQIISLIPHRRSLEDIFMETTRASEAV